MVLATASGRMRRHQGLLWTVSLFILLAAVGQYLLAPAYGAQLGQRALNLTTNEAGVSSLHRLVFSITSTGPIGSIQVQFCSNGPFVQDPCVAPAGMDATGAALAAQSGQIGFSISPASDANTIILTRPPVVATPGRAIYDFNPVINPSVPGSYFVRIQTFATTDASGPASDFGAIAYVIVNQFSVTAEVPPYLLFCTGITISGQNCVNAVGNYIDFGEFSSTKASTATSQMLAATNAQGGYSVTISGTTLTSGNNAIAALTSSDVSRPGTPQFGFNLRANVAPSSGNDVTGPGTANPSLPYGLPNVFRFAPGEIIATQSVPDDVRVYTASYIANVPKSQSPGIYVSTVTYICLANF
ncbi:MAG: hypothetical protein ABIV43_01460 [Candidatus Saccharimonadales bacterium]